MGPLPGLPLTSRMTLGKLLSLDEQPEWTMAIELAQTPGRPFC